MRIDQIRLKLAALIVGELSIACNVLVKGCLITNGDAALLKNCKVIGEGETTPAITVRQ